MSLLQSCSGHKPSRSLGTTVTYWLISATQQNYPMKYHARYSWLFYSQTIVNGWGTIPTFPIRKWGLRFLHHRLFVFSTKLARLSIISGQVQSTQWAPIKLGPFKKMQLQRIYPHCRTELNVYLRWLGPPANLYWLHPVVISDYGVG